jgi:hypothetical protein
MLPFVDFDSSYAVSEFVRSKFTAIYENSDDSFLRTLFQDVDLLFTGNTAAYAAIDLKYHDLRHTLMATVCMGFLLEGHHQSDGKAKLTPREFELAIASVLLHDAGYLKLKSDTKGTGAKYTFCHITRSCAFASSYLPEIGVTEYELETVLSSITCTGPTSEINRQRFREPGNKIIGCLLATADYLGQLSDPDYPDKLGHLFDEFHESDVYAHVPVSRRGFRSAEDLIRRTPGFWLKFVKPKLDHDFLSAYKLLERPLGSGNNAYLDAIAENFATIERRIAG